MKSRIDKAPSDASAEPVGDDVRRNIEIHNRIARRYEARHGEIFNQVEQSRLRLLLGAAIAEVQTGRAPLRALDFGCGSGNLTGHMLALGAEVTAADVAPRFLDLVRDRYPGARLQTFQLNGRDLDDIAEGSFDLVATYSVLHHIPDYLAACADMARVTQAGGVVVIDHEASPGAWSDDPVYREFRRAALRLDWRKYLTPINYVHRMRRILNPRHSNEGDIHVWPDDHIEWDKIGQVMHQNGLETVIEQDYLLNRRIYRPEVYERYQDRCSDTRVMVFRKAL